MAKKTAETTAEVIVAPTDPAKMYFTVIRGLPGDKNDKPNAFLFVAREKQSDAVMEQIFHDKDLRAMLPADMPVMCLRYYKLPTTTPGFLPEWRIVLTTLSHYTLPLNDERDNVTMMWEEKRDQTAPPKVVQYKDLLANCTDLHRIDGCNGCPNKGLECVKLQFGGRPWTWHLAYNRKTEWDTGLAEGTTVTDRNNKNKEHEFAGKNLDAIFEQCAKLTPAGGIFRHPDNTRPLDTPQMMTHPLRSARAHRFFRDPHAKVTSSEEKAK